MKTFLRIAWAAAVVALGGCTALLGVDHEYQLGSTTTQGSGGAGGGTTAATTGVSGTGGGGAGATGTSTSTSTGMSTSTGTSGGSCADATDCTLCPTQDKTCVECCAKANPDAQTKYSNLLFAMCACAPSSPCRKQCGGSSVTMPPFCQDSTLAPTQACAMCVSGLGMDTCVVNAGKFCMNDSVCQALGTCEQSCSG